MLYQTGEGPNETSYIVYGRQKGQANPPRQQKLATLEQDGPTPGDALRQCNNERQVLCNHALKGCHFISIGSAINIPRLVGIVREFKPVGQPLG
jgi:hypothetical protein